MSTTRPGLRLPVMAMSLVVPFRALQEGAKDEDVAAFLRRHVGPASGLLSWSGMSGQDLQEHAERLLDQYGIVEGSDYAACCGMGGPFVSHPSIRFEAPYREYRPWFAYLVEDDPRRYS